MKRSSWLIWGALAGVLVVAGLVAVLASGGGGSGGGSDGAAAGNGTSSRYQQAPVTVTGAPLSAFVDSVGDTAVGHTMPTVTGSSVLDGSPVVIHPTGKPQAIVFVAHWCPHCQREVPRLVALAKAGKLRGVDVIAVATGTNSNAPNYPPSAWLKREGWPYPVMADSTAYEAAQAFGLTAYPTFVLVDGQGKVVGRAAGEVSDAAIIANVKALVAGKKLPLIQSGASSSAS